MAIISKINNIIIFFFQCSSSRGWYEKLGQTSQWGHEKSTQYSPGKQLINSFHAGFSIRTGSWRNSLNKNAKI